jgi:hypothetical protein
MTHYTRQIRALLPVGIAWIGGAAVLCAAELLMGSI